MGNLSRFGAFQQQQMAQMAPPPDPITAYQPNYSLFWDPYAMLAQGNPQLAAPWYQSQQVQPQMPAQAAPQARSLGILGRSLPPTGNAFRDQALSRVLPMLSLLRGGF